MGLIVTSGATNNVGRNVVFSFRSFFFMENNFFQVRTSGTGVRGWLDASHETNNWLKYVRSTGNPHAVNMRHVLIGGQVTDVHSNVI